MLSPLEFLMLFGAAAALWFTRTSLKVRELANRIALEYCETANVQFLDGSVGFGTLGLVREEGRFRVRRVYVFDYTESSVHRRHAAIEFVGGEFRNLLLLES
jgi:hypothetical protein